MSEMSMEQKAAALEEEHLAPPIDSKAMDGIEFAQGKCFIQHDAESVNVLIAQTLLWAWQADSSYAAFVDRKVGEGKVQSATDPILLNMCSRYIQGSGAKPLERLLERCLHIDPLNGTEWGQSYFSRGDGRAHRAGAQCLNPGVALAMKEQAALDGETVRTEAPSSTRARL